MSINNFKKNVNINITIYIYNYIQLCVCEITQDSISFMEFMKCYWFDSPKERKINLFPFKYSGIKK